MKGRVYRSKAMVPLSLSFFLLCWDLATVTMTILKFSLMHKIFL